ncbi:MAG: hypothetical protein K6F32_05330 [Bacilli bacterium]|nr:hypothetical protein [Bacilli bacterium]
MKPKAIFSIAFLPLFLCSCSVFSDKASDFFTYGVTSVNGDLYFNDVVLNVDATTKTVNVTYKDFASSYVTIKTISDDAPEFQTSDYTQNWLGFKTTVDRYWYMYSIELEEQDKAVIVGVLQSLIDAQVKEKVENGSTRQELINLYYYKVFDIALCVFEKRVDGKFDERRFCLYAMINPDGCQYYNGNGIYRLAPE